MPASALGHAVDASSIVEIGRSRVAAYQDAAYGEIFMQRVGRLRAVARRFGAAEDGELVTEGARFLALWMCYDDVIRVADLKSRAARYRRLAVGAGARPGDVLRISDHLKPGIAEFAGLLPPRLAGPLLGWESRRRRDGAAPLSWRLTLRADTVGGFLALRLLASLRPMRTAGSRHAEEQALIEDWLGAVEGASGAGAARELALCARIIKGYGATNERAKESFRCIINHLKSNGEGEIRRARLAALDEEIGAAFDEALRVAGAPPRPVQAVPVRWTKRRVQAT